MAGITLDTVTIAQLCATLQGMNVQDADAYLKALHVHYPHLVRIMRMTLGGYSTEVSPVGIASRSEWLALIRAGKAFSTGVLVGAVAAQQGYIRIRNAASDGSRILVYQVTVASSVVGDLIVSGSEGVIAGEAAATLRSKLADGGTLAGSTTVATTGTRAAAPGGQQLVRLPLQAGVTFVKNSPQGFLWEISGPTGDLVFNTFVANSNSYFDIDMAIVPSTYG